MTANRERTAQIPPKDRHVINAPPAICGWPFGTTRPGNHCLASQELNQVRCQRDNIENALSSAQKVRLLRITLAVAS